MGVIDNAVQWATDIANDDSHWYSQDVRWGPHYDCSSFVITAYQNVGVPVKDNGATYTGDMYNVFISCGFKDVTSSCNLSNGAGMLKGDVLLNKADHTALVQADGGTTVEARGTSFGIVTNVPYRNYPWIVYSDIPKTETVILQTGLREKYRTSESRSQLNHIWHTKHIRTVKQADINTCGAVTAVRQTADCESTKILFVWHSVRITDRTARLLRLNLTTVK